MGDRYLLDPFMNDLKDASGVLHELLCSVKADDTLDLQIRDNAINVYYRGSSLVKVEPRLRGGYWFDFNTNYMRGGTPRAKPELIADVAACKSWLDGVPTRKNAIDIYGAGREREIQQVLVRENNYGRGSVPKATDYFVIDVEYAKKDHGRADVVAVCVPSTSSDRKVADSDEKAKKRRLAIIELKFGDAAVSGGSGLLEHVKQAGLLAKNGTREPFCDEMLGIYHQKLTLKLLGEAPEQLVVDKSVLDFIIVIANHDPAKSALKRELAAIIGNYPANLTLWVASASQFGYGLFCDDQHMIPIEDFYKSLP